MGQGLKPGAFQRHGRSTEYTTCTTPPRPLAGEAAPSRRVAAIVGRAQGERERLRGAGVQQLALGARRRAVFLLRLPVVGLGDERARQTGSSTSIIRMFYSLDFFSVAPSAQEEEGVSGFFCLFLLSAA